ncbi:unnamed protein product [[Actinomadura] parvosata subsp. kistnae]|nr:unnamed protein product [Actinomadura parvosata subsp. kistnae]
MTARLEEARLTLSGLVAGDAARARAAVAEIVADERFLDALVSDAPGLYRDLRRGAKGGRTRRELAEQVQRLSASCETAGCYGPVNYGAVTAGHPGGYTWEGAAACARRVAYPAARVSEALQQRVLAEPGLVAGLVPRRKTWTGEVLDGAAFVGHCDGGRTLAEIAAGTGAGVERASAALAVAVRRGLLTHDLCPPATICDPLGWLRERLIARGVRVAAGDPPAEEGGGRPAPGHGRGAFSGRCECGCAEATGRGRAGREESTGRGRAGSAGSAGRGRGGARRAPGESAPGTRRVTGHAAPAARVAGQVARAVGRGSRGCAGCWRPGCPSGRSWPVAACRRSASGPPSGRGPSRTRTCRWGGASARSASCSPNTRQPPPT